MTARNDITGDAIRSASTKAYKDNYDAIFGKKNKPVEAPIKDVTDEFDRDTYETPMNVFNYFNDQYDFDVDICAQDHTAKCANYLTKEQDALSKSWCFEGDRIWCNPPYSDIKPWIEKAIEAKSDGSLVVMLVMADQSVGWFKRALSEVNEIVIVTGGRLSFNANGVPQKGNNKGSMLLVFRPHDSTQTTTYLDRSVF